MILLVTTFLLLFPARALASAGVEARGLLDLTATGFGMAAVIVFLISYALVISEEFLRLRKSKPVIIAAGIIWALVGLAYALQGDTETAAAAFRHHLVDYAELLLFLMAAMTYVNTLEERNIFNVIRARLISSGLSLRAIFWITGGLAFLISPVADNLTTALVMAAVVLAIGEGRPRFIGPACVNIVVAANAGGAFSPFGDITTLMVWQKGILGFFEFFRLLVPSLVNWLVPAAIMSLAVGTAHPGRADRDAPLRPGAATVVLLFLCTIAGTVLLHTLLHLPPALGMMTGLGALKLYSYRLVRAGRATASVGDTLADVAPRPAPGDTFDIFKILERVEWDTLMRMEAESRARTSNGSEENLTFPAPPRQPLAPCWRGTPSTAGPARP